MIKCEACRAFYCFFEISLINSIIHEQMLDSIYHMTLKLLKKHFFCVKMSRYCHLLPTLKSGFILGFENQGGFLKKSKLFS